MMGYGSGMGGAGLFGLLMMVGLILLLVLLGGGFRRGDGGGSRRPSAAPTQAPARRPLDERYARGELSTEEYQERLWTLEQSD